MIIVWDSWQKNEKNMMIMKKEMIIIRWRSLQQMIISWPGLHQAGTQGASSTWPGWEGGDLGASPPVVNH